MKAEPGALPGLMVFEPVRYRDHRGLFFEAWSRDRYAAAGVAGEFVQDNVSISRRGVLRGLHFQHPDGQGKLVQALRGHVYDVAVDIRVGSPTFGRWAGVHLSEENGSQLWIPPGFAHGFQVLSDEAIFSYKCTALYCAAHDGAIRWDDPDIGIAWPLSDPVMSPKDQQAPLLRELQLDRLPAFP